jgi:alkaline phosphatase D
VVATEFVGTSVTSKGNGPKVIKGLDALLAENPQVRFHNDQRGYVRCTVTPKEWRSDYQIVEDVVKPGCPVATGASFLIQAGKPGAVKG